MGFNPMNNNQNNYNQMNNNNLYNNNPMNNNQINNNNPSTFNQINNNQVNYNQNNNNPIGFNPMNNNNMANMNANNEMNKVNNNENQINQNLPNLGNNPNDNNINNQNQSRNNKPSNDKYSFSRYKKASRTGLMNFGDTSYLNAVLQLLGTSRNLSSFLINPANTKFFIDNIYNSPLSFVIHRLFLHFYPYPERALPEIYKPDTLLKILGDLNIVYNSMDARNPNDLIIFILNKLHEEMNKKKSKPIPDEELDNKNKEDFIPKFMQYFMGTNDSIISNNFSYFESNTQRCPNCQNNFYYMKNYNVLELDISGCFGATKNNPLTISKCLEYQTNKKQNLFCKICNTYTMMDIITNIYSTPIYFVFSLNRGNLNENGNLLKIPFLIENKIDLKQFVEFGQSFKNFELESIVSISLNEKKYVCFGKSPVDKQWYLYNDDKVINCGLNDVLNMNNNNQAYIPCLLLYKFIK